MWLGSSCCTRGQLIYREGDVADAVYMITDGTVETYRLDHGMKTQLARLGPGRGFWRGCIFH